MLKIEFDNSSIPLDSMQYSKENKSISRYSSSKNINLTVETPFKLSKIKDDLFKPEIDIERILILRNDLFAERNFIELKAALNGENKSVGYIFTLRTILDDEGIHLENDKLIPYFLRTIVTLLDKKVDFNPNIPKISTTNHLDLYDFYPENIIICAVSKQQFHNFDRNAEVSLLYHLGLYGFHPIYDNNGVYKPPSEIQKKAFNSILINGKGTIFFKQIHSDLLNEPFIEKFIKKHSGRERDDIAFFLLTYQIFEILIDKVLKRELQIKFNTLTNNEDVSAYKMRKDIQEISTESYRIKKLFNHYCDFNQSSDYETCYFIECLFEKHLNNKDKEDYGTYFYKFRNQIVHNLRSFYTEDDSIADNDPDLISKIVSSIETLTIESIISFDPNK